MTNVCPMLGVPISSSRPLPRPGLVGRVLREVEELVPSFFSHSRILYRRSRDMGYLVAPW